MPQPAVSLPFNFKRIRRRVPPGNDLPEHGGITGALTPDAGPALGNAGTVTGTGTAGQFAKWSSSTALGNATAGTDYENPLTFSSPLSRSTNTISCPTCGLTSNPLSQFASTTSAQLAGVLSDETGSGAAVFGTSPNITAPTGIVKGDVGLGNVDNTSDASKPVSTAQQAALDLKADASALPTVTRVSAQFDKTSSTAFSNVPGLSVTVTAGRTYKFRAMLHHSTAGAGGGKVQIAGTATATSIIYHYTVWDDDAGQPSSNGRATALSSAIAGAGMPTATFEIEGVITVNAGGTLLIQFAQFASNATASSILVGSTFAVAPVS